jgi:hypothetical protein
MSVARVEGRSTGVVPLLDGIGAPEGSCGATVVDGTSGIGAGAGPGPLGFPPTHWE